MRFTRLSATCASMVLALAMHQGAMAQTNDADALMALGEDALEDAITQRFNAALAASNDGAIVGADDPRYLWAIEAKAQCGIALGYLKSDTRDPVSISKCGRFSALMMDDTKRVTMIPTEVEVETEVSCDLPSLIFFGWNIPTPPENANDVVGYVAQNRERCGWSTFEAVGHADASGSPGYNMDLSRERAQNVADMLGAALGGTAVAVDYKGESDLKVPTPDGVRELQNRRVEIKVR